MQLDDVPSIKDLIFSGQANKPADLWPAHSAEGVVSDNLDRSTMLTSSEASNCPRRIWYGKQEKSRPLGTWGYAERGHSVEAWVVKRLRWAQSDWAIDYLGDDQRSFVHTTARLSGTPDGLLTKTVDGVVYGVTLEIKSIDPRLNKANLPKAGHVPQTHQNTWLLSCAFPTITMLGSVLVYVDASNFEAIDEFLIDYDPEVVEEHKLLAKQVFAATTVTDLPALGLYRDECRLCDHRLKCNRDITAERVARTTLEAPTEGEKQNDIAIRKSRLFGQP